jgi:1-pyrroline-5-carboxylate dehydrogenase
VLDIPLPSAPPVNEPVLGYAPKSPERAALKEALAKLSGECPDVGHMIGGQELREGESFDVVAPHDFRNVLAKAHQSSHAITEKAISAAKNAAPGWAALSLADRARIFLRAADLLAGPFRQTLNAATMLGQSKTAFQAEIDAACELVDFLRFNAHYATKLVEQPISPAGMHNALELRPLEGFVLAITPFNFTAIAGNLPASCALMGNVVVWKPAETQVLAAHHTVRLFEAAGLPAGVINVVHGDGARVSEACLASPDLAGIHFTGSTRVFQSLWRGVGERITTYRSYPRIVGETGGKDFVFAHPSAELEPLAVALVRGAFEFQGQKCSAASRAYVPRSLWPKLEERLRALVAELTVGDVTDFRNFMGAVIDARAHARLTGWLERLRSDSSCKVLCDAGWSRETGYFAGPTAVEVHDPKHPLMQEELFGPILGIYVYDDALLEETLTLVDQTSPYALTGAIFSQDRPFVVHAAKRLRQAAGNLYVNDKPTGAVVGQQPFGGARGSGTNDKAGSALNLMRWVSPRTVKETFVPPRAVGYPFMQES